MDKNKDDDALEHLMGKLGDFGRYQRFQFLLHILAGGTAGLHVLTLATVAFTPDHRCAIPEVDVNGTVAPWDTPEVVAAIPAMHTGGLHSCHIFNATNHTVPCDEWVFDPTYRTSSRVIDWNLVCDRRWMVALAQCCYMLGVFTGGIVLGRVSDKIGRKKVFCVSATLQLILGVLDAFVPEFFTFLVVRYLYGIFGSSGAYIAAFVLTMELVGPSKRTVCGVSFQVAFAVGIMVVAGWATIIADRVWLQVVYGLHALLLMPHWWIMDESPRWLWAQGRIGESIAIIQKALNMNGINYTIDTAEYVSKAKARENRNEEPAGLGELFRYPNLRKKTMNICLCWFANSLVYYGLALNTGKLYGHPNFNLFLSGLTELPSYLIILYCLDVFGHRTLISSFMLTGGVLCIVVTFLAQGTTLSTTLVLFGKMFISGSFSIAYKYSAELFPTVVRNSALGLGSMFASLSGAMTPLITLLDSFDPRIPSNIFGVIALVSGALCLFLPETLGHPMLQTIADGEEFGVGDTCFTTCLGSHRNEKKKQQLDEDEAAQETMIPLENITKA